MKHVYFCPYCDAVGWSKASQEFEIHVLKKHGKLIKANFCFTSKVKVFDRYLEREKFENEVKVL